MERVIIRVEEGVEKPEYKTDKAVGFDLTINKILKAYKGDVETTGEKLDRMKETFNRGNIKMRPFERILFGTGIFIKLPKNIDMEIRPRSGTSLKTGVMITNSPGTIDGDYIDMEIGIIVSNVCPYLTTIEKNSRIAQAVLRNTIQGELVYVNTIETTEIYNRVGGFGSTGNK